MIILKAAEGLCSWAVLEKPSGYKWGLASPSQILQQRRQSVWNYPGDSAWITDDEEGIVLSPNALYSHIILNELEYYIQKNYIWCSSMTFSKHRDVLPFLKVLPSISNSSKSNCTFNSGQSLFSFLSIQSLSFPEWLVEYGWRTYLSVCLWLGITFWRVIHLLFVLVILISLLKIFLWMDIPQCTNYAVERHLDCFQFGAIINVATVAFTVFIVHGFGVVIDVLAFWDRLYAAQAALTSLHSSTSSPVPGLQAHGTMDGLLCSFSKHMFSFILCKCFGENFCAILEVYFLYKMCRAVFQIMLFYISTKGSGD